MIGRSALRRTVLRLAVASGTMLVAATGAVTFATQPARAGDCWGASCNLVYPYLDHSYDPGPWSNCANEGGWQVEPQPGDNFTIALWYSNGCNANWARIRFPAGSGLHSVWVYSTSPAWNDNGHEVGSDTADSSTYMVDGSYLAMACGSDAWGRACTNWH
jgi:hypothetical protein